MGDGPVEWNNHAITLLQSGDPEALPRAVNLLRRAAAAAPDGSSERLAYLCNLYVAVRMGIHETADHLVTLTDIGYQAAAGADDDPSFAGVLGEDLHRRFALTGEPRVLDDAIRLLESAAGRLRPGDLNQLAVAGSLCQALTSRFRLTDDPADLRAAVAGGRRAAQSAPPGDTNVAAILDATAVALLELSERTGAGGLLDEAVALLRRGLDVLAAGDPRRQALRSNLGAVLLARGEPGSAAAVVRLFDEVGREAARTPLPADLRAAYHTNRSEALRRLHEETGDEAALRDAVAAGRFATAAAPPGGSRRAQAEMALALAIGREFRRTGDLAHLEEAIGRLRAALAMPGQPVAFRARALHLLGSALDRRHRHTGDSASLDEAVDACRRSVELLGADVPDRVNHLNTLGAVLLSRHRRTGVRPVLAEAVAVFRAVVAATPDDHPHRAGRRHNLANTLRDEAALTGDPATLDEAVNLLRDAGAAPGSEEESSCRNDLAIVLRSRHARTGDRADLDEAVGHLRAAAAAAAPGTAARARRLSNLGFALLAQAQADEDSTRAGPAPDEVVAAFAEAATAEAAAPEHRVEDAREWGRALAAAGDRAGAAAGYELAVSLLPQVASGRLARRDQEYGLSQYSGLAAEAAACVVRAGDPERAVRLLEQGRGILLGRELDARADLGALRAAHPDLAGQVAELRDLMAAPAAPETGDWLAGAAREADRRHAMTAAWDKLTARIRALDGFAGFLAPPDAGQLRAAAADGPVVLVNVSPYGSDALILTGDGVVVVPLPDVTPEIVTARAQMFHTAVHAARTPGPGERPAQDTLRETLGWLWDAVAGPVVDRLGPGVRRLWWSPTGPLAFLPLHAAGHHDQPGQSVLDRVVSSYTPTVRALMHARDHAGRPADPAVTAAGPLVVAMPETPGAPDLPRARQEADELAALAPALRLTGGEATSSRVRAELPRHGTVHFACHGVSEPDEPSAGRLLLHDHAADPLTVSAVARLDLTGARLAYLSACHTAQGAPHLSDEAVHITSAFQLAGYPHVIGTLWPVNDRVAARLALAVHRGLRPGDPTGPDTALAAKALHDAVRECRAAYPATPSLWSAHIHAGA